MNMQPIHVKAKSQHHFYKEILVVFCLFHMWVLLRLHINSSNFGTNRTKLFAFHANSPLAQQELSIFRTLLQQHRQYNSDLQAKKKPSTADTQAPLPSFCFSQSACVPWPAWRLASSFKHLKTSIIKTKTGCWIIQY